MIGEEKVMRKASGSAIVNDASQNDEIGIEKEMEFHLEDNCKEFVI